MRKEKRIGLCAAVAICAISGSLLWLRASETVDIESAMAGAAIDINNYFAGSLEPEKELHNFLFSERITGVALQKEEIPADPSADTPFAAEPEINETTEGTESHTEAESQTGESVTESESWTEAPTEPETVAPKVSPYANVAVSHVRSNSYVNIRTQPTTSSDVVGKLYNDCAATILDTVEGEDGIWYEIKSGTCRGYIKAEYFLTGDEAEARAIEIGKLEGRVNGNGVRLRSEASLESSILTLLFSGEKYAVLETGEEFVKVLVDDDLVGYVYAELMDVSVKFDTAISLEEEKAKKEEEARKKAEAEAAKKRLEEAKKAAEEAEKNAQDQTTAAEENTPAPSTPPSVSVTTASRDALVAYAKQWVGVSPYVYGGTSLTKGIDCSAFVQACYANALGVSIPRNSRSQAAKCTTISEGDLQPGDLVFYNKGGEINHVAMYIGGGQVVHASNAKVGTIISNMKYREPCQYGRFIN